MELTNLTPSVRKIFEMSGVLKLIPEVNLQEKYLDLTQDKEEISEAAEEEMRCRENLS